MTPLLAAKIFTLTLGIATLMSTMIRAYYKQTIPGGNVFLTGLSFAAFAALMGWL